MAVGVLKSNAYGLIPDQVPGLSGRGVKGSEGTGTQAWVTGSVLINSSGTAIEASANPVANIIGVSAGKATGTSTSEAIYYPATPDFVFTATLENQSAQDKTLALTDLFTNHALQVDTNHNWYVDSNNTTNVCCVIVAPVNWADVTNATVRSRVKIVFLISKTVYTV